MPRIIWRRRGVEWVGRLTNAGPDRFAVRRVFVAAGMAWELTDRTFQRCGLYELLRDAKSAAYQMLTEANR